MADNSAHGTTASGSPLVLQYRLVHVFYAMAVLGAALATFGAAGLPLVAPILGFWAYVYGNRSRPRGLAKGCLGLLVCGCLIGLLLPGIEEAREAARRTQCSNNVKQLALALHNYHDVYDSFPPAYVADQSGKPMHSWRVLLLPFAEQRSLYAKYDFHEPWDGPNNIKLLNPMPDLYRCPSDERFRKGPAGTVAWTSYVAVVGPQTVWPGAKSRKSADVKDGTSTAIWIVEDQSRNIAWSEPRDLSYDEALQLLTSTDPNSAGIHHRDEFFNEYSGGRHVGLVDGTVSFLVDGQTREVAASLLNIDDGYRPPDDFPSSPWAYRQLNFGKRYRLAVFVLLTLLPLPWVWRKREPAPSGERTVAVVEPE